MCGIAGILNRGGQPASPVLLRRMADAIRHRGPDGEGYFTDANFGVAHRRLAIIDLSPAGHQPMLTPDGRFALSYNGEVYNYQELRLELEAKGWRFRSRTDSEVVLYALAEWGTAAIPRFNGMFALALWDAKARELLLARDRYGVKPLYYAEVGGTLLFGSEVKALIAHPAFHAALDPQALAEYFTFQNFFGDRTLFKGVHLLAPGSWLKLSADRAAARPEQYWDFGFAEPIEPEPPEAYTERLDFLFRRAVSRQLVGDAPIGAYLSGGMDSGSIAAIAAPQLDLLRSFTVGFDLRSASGLELAFDEREKAEHMSYLFKTEHYEMVLKAGDMERVLPQLIWHMEEPRVGQSYPNYYAAGLAGRFVKVVLSGTGGDELFAGYPWRYYRALVNADFEDYVDKYFGFWQRLLPQDTAPEVLRPVWGEAKQVSPRDIFRDVFGRHANRLTRPQDYINHSLYFEAKTFLHGLLVIEDKLSMAHSLETRVPFLDNDLVDFAATVPVARKLANLGEVIRLNENEPGPKSARYFEKTRDGKLLLRDTMRRYIPAQVADGLKQGFSAPDASWFRGESIDYVRAVLYDKRARLYDFLDYGAVTRLIDDHLAGRENRRLLIWSLLSVEQWCKTFLG